MTKEKLKTYLFGLLAKRDYSKQELVEKAKQKEYTLNDIQEVLSEFEQKKYIDDQRLAENLVLFYKEKKGPVWIRQKMQQRKIASDIITQTLKNEPNDSISEDLKTKLEKKYNVDNWASVEPKTLQKIYGYLQRSGFKNVFGVVKKWKENLD